MFLALTGALAAEPGFAASRPGLVPLDADPRDPVSVERPGAMTEGDLFGGVATRYEQAPWEGDPSRLRHVGWLSLGVGAVLHRRLRLDLQAPIALVSEDDGGWKGPGLGDLRMRAMVHVLSPELIVGSGGGPGLALIGEADLPSGAAARHLGWGDPSGSVGVAATWELRRATVSADAVFAARPEPVIAPELGGRAVEAGLALGYLLTPDLGLTLESTLRKPLASELGADASVTLRHRRFLVSAGTGLVLAPATPAFRLTVGTTWGPDPQARFPDVDREGRVDIRDACPLEPETVNGYLDDDGCPDELSALSVVARWRDGPVDARVTLSHRDTVREEDLPVSGLALDVVPGSAWTAEARATCLEGRGGARATAEGSVLEILMQPVHTNTATVRVKDPAGVPLAGRVFFERAGEDPCVPADVLEVGEQGREVRFGVGEHRLTASAPGFRTATQPVVAGAELTFVLEDLGLRVTDGRLVLNEPLAFDGAELAPHHPPGLAQVAAWLKLQPNVRLTIEGHTNNVGREDENIRLSRARAQAVLDHLSALGVPPERLEAHGLGPTQPIDTNRTATGRRRNERIELVLVEAP